MQDGPHDKTGQNGIDHEVRLLLPAEFPSLLFALSLEGGVDIPDAVLFIRGWTPGSVHGCHISRASIEGVLVPNGRIINRAIAACDYKALD